MELVLVILVLMCCGGKLVRAVFGLIGWLIAVVNLIAIFPLRRGNIA